MVQLGKFGMDKNEFKLLIGVFGMVFSKVRLYKELHPDTGFAVRQL